MLEVLNFMVREMIREDLNIEELMSLAEEVSKNKALASTLQSRSNAGRGHTLPTPAQVHYV